MQCKNTCRILSIKSMAYLPELYPWQETAWKQLSLARLPHAILITGAEGTGKFRFASKLAMALLCSDTQSRPCGECRNCRFFGAATHPDLHVLSSEAKLEFMDSVMVSFAERYLEDERARAKRKTRRSSIVIDQIRALIESASVKPHISENKVFLIDPIDSMTHAAANSLLKVLEEPPPNTYLILMAVNDQYLLPTITSRCQSLVIPEPDRDSSATWLKAMGLDSAAVDAIINSGKGPVLGLRLAKDNEVLHTGVFIAKLLQYLQQSREVEYYSLVELGVKLGESECLEALHLLVSTMIREHGSQPSDTHLTKNRLTDCSSRAGTRQLFMLYDHIGSLRKQLRGGGMDKSLIVEDAILAFESALT